MHYDKHLLLYLLTYPYLHKGSTRFLQLWMIAVCTKEIKYRKMGECAHTTKRKKQHQNKLSISNLPVRLRDFETK